MSIVTDITRIMNAKADIKTAIEEKGVEVGDGLIDTYAEKIAEITGGGGDSYYDTFWDAFQVNGTRTDYSYAFRNIAFSDEMFKPKYKICPVNATNMFTDLDIGDSTLGTDYENGDYESKYLDFSNCTLMTYCFCRTTLKRLPILNLTKVTNLSNAFAVMKNLERIEKIIISKKSGESFHTNTFNSSTKLSYIRFEGANIYCNFNMGGCPLSVDSMKNIIEHLENLMELGEDGYFQLSFSSSCWAALEASGGVPDGYETWREYVEYGKGWAT